MKPTKSQLITILSNPSLSVEARRRFELLFIDNMATDLTKSK